MLPDGVFPEVRDVLEELFDPVAPDFFSRFVSFVLVALPDAAVGEDEVAESDPVGAAVSVLVEDGAVATEGGDDSAEPPGSLPVDPLPVPLGAAGALEVGVGVDRCVGVLVRDGAGAAGGGVLGAPPDPRLAPTTLPGAGS